MLKVYYSCSIVTRVPGGSFAIYLFFTKSNILELQSSRIVFKDTKL
jgi:hypothetical protein